MEETIEVDGNSSVDQASLGLAAIAATWALFGTPGDWGAPAVVIGLSVLFLLLGYHSGTGRSPRTWRGWFKRSSFAALLALAVCLVLAWPLQEGILQVDSAYVPDAQPPYHRAADDTTFWLFCCGWPLLLILFVAIEPRIVRLLSSNPQRRGQSAGLVARTGR